MGLYLKNLRKKIPKGSLRDPFCYLGIISVILFGILIFVTNSIFNSPSTENFSLLDLPVSRLNQADNQKLFLSQNKTSLLEFPELILVQETSLKGVSSPTILNLKVFGVLIGKEEEPEIRKEIIEYMVEQGDALWSIATKFNISINTLLWANNLNQNLIIKPGQKLVILPISGVIHHVQKGDTLSEIAKTYKGKTEEIISFNELSEEGDIYIGDILIIPNGIIPPPPTPIYVEVPLASSYFICPISSPCKITQGLHWYNAVDFSHGKCGEPIYAAAGGKVLKVKLTNSTSRWAFGGAGNHLTILHPNGVVTMYGHIALSLVNPNQEVHQGQIIALVGGAPGTPGAGKSTGCHLHFGVQGAKNPFAK